MEFWGIMSKTIRIMVFYFSIIIAGSVIGGSVDGFHAYFINGHNSTLAGNISSAEIISKDNADSIYHRVKRGAITGSAMGLVMAFLCHIRNNSKSS